MEILLESVIIYASWNLGHTLTWRLKLIKPLQDLADIIFAGIILTIVAVLFPAITF